MTNDINIRQTVIAIVAAAVISSTVVLGTVGPVQAGAPAAHYLANNVGIEIPSVLIA